MRSWPDTYFGPAVIRYSGNDMPAQPTVEYVGCVVTDDPTNHKTVVTIAALPSLGTGVGTWMTTPSSANLLAAMTDEVGTGKIVFNTDPQFISTMSVAATSGGPRYIFTPNASMVASHVINLPLLTGGDNMVCESFTQPLTNKTIVAASNTITDTSAATGDLFRHNGTRFVRLARGSANQVLTTNAGATDIAWATPSGLGTNVLSGSGFISIGATPAATGGLRLANNTNVVAKDTGGTDRVVMGLDASNYYQFGAGSFQSLATGDDLIIGSAAGQVGRGNTNQFGFSVPLCGGPSAYGTVDGNAPIAVSTANITLAAAQYSRRTQKFTGAPAATRTITYPLPATDDQCYDKIVWCQTSVSGVTITNGGGTTVTLVVNDAPHHLWFHQAGVTKILT